MTPDRPPVKWIDLTDIAAIESQVRVEQERALADVLALYDGLTALFVPAVPGHKKASTDQLAAMQALESGLFGHLRSVRAAVANGWIQDVYMQLRTIREIHKKAELCLAYAAFAARIAANREIRMAEVDGLYAKLLEARGTPLGSAQRDRDRDRTQKSSWLVHARHRGLQFMVLRAPEGGAVITREPPALHLPDRGRVGALEVLVTAFDAVRALVPTILKSYGLPVAEWRARERAFGGKLTDGLAPYYVAKLLRERDPQTSVNVGARGEVSQDGAVLDLDVAARSLGVDDLRRALAEATVPTREGPSDEAHPR